MVPARGDLNQPLSQSAGGTLRQTRGPFLLSKSLHLIPHGCCLWVISLQEYSKTPCGENQMQCVTGASHLLPFFSSFFFSIYQLQSHLPLTCCYITMLLSAQPSLNCTECNNFRVQNVGNTNEFHYFYLVVQRQNKTNRMHLFNCSSESRANERTRSLRFSVGVTFDEWDDLWTQSTRMWPPRTETKHLTNCRVQDCVSPSKR